MPPKKIKKEDANVETTRNRAANWRQCDTELLASLILQYGQKGILSKETNASTNQVKDTEWAKIHLEFNATDTVSPFDRNKVVS